MPISFLILVIDRGKTTYPLTKLKNTQSYWVVQPYLDGVYFFDLPPSLASKYLKKIPLTSYIINYQLVTINIYQRLEL
jgi:hypothetical protein